MIGIGPSNSWKRRMAVRPSMPGRRTSSTINSGRWAGQLEALFRRGRRGDGVPQLGGQLAQPPANALFVVNYQQVCHVASFRQEGKFQGKAGHAVGLPPADRTSVGLDDLPGDKQPQARPVRFLRHKRLEQLARESPRPGRGRSPLSQHGDRCLAIGLRPFLSPLTHDMLRRTVVPGEGRGRALRAFVPRPSAIAGRRPRWR